MPCRALPLHCIPKGRRLTVPCSAPRRRATLLTSTTSRDGSQYSLRLCTVTPPDERVLSDTPTGTMATWSVPLAAPWHLATRVGWLLQGAAGASAGAAAFLYGCQKLGLQSPLTTILQPKGLWWLSTVAIVSSEAALLVHSSSSSSVSTAASGGPWPVGVWQMWSGKAFWWPLCSVLGALAVLQASFLRQATLIESQKANWPAQVVA
jgi:hypothetical protein